MEYLTHDLLKIHTDLNIQPLSDWAAASLEKCPFVVVRRAPSAGKMIPVGIRGANRKERQAAFISEEDVLERISPTEITAEKRWNKLINFPRDLRMVLKKTSALFSNLNIRWGPTGSVGFYLASGLCVINEQSDLDLAIYSDSIFSRGAAKMILDDINAIADGLNIDALVETPVGAVLLTENADIKRKILMRTVHGPVLIENYKEC